jgi:hypothetical protein
MFRKDKGDQVRNLNLYSHQTISLFVVEGISSSHFNLNNIRKTAIQVGM